jgi:hypothetical protein
MFGTNIRSYLKGTVTKEAGVQLEHYLAKIALERFKASGLDLDWDSEVEDATQAFLVYLKGTWFPNHKSSVANRTDEELGKWVVLAYHRWLTGLIETKRAEIKPEPMLEGEQEADTIWHENQPTSKAVEAREAFEKAFGYAAVEWTRREKRADFRFILRLIQRGLKGGDSAEEIFSRIVRAIAGKTLQFPKPKELLYAHFRGLLEKLYPGYFTQQELAYIIGLEEASVYHQTVKEREWEKPSELEEEIEFRRIAALSGNEGSDDVSLWARVDDVIRQKSKMVPIDIEERAERLADALEYMRENNIDPRTGPGC